jgi:hypothetical protein
VYKRLRGTERSIVAADLAQVYLDDRRPSEALRVIRSTRIAGLDDETNLRRKLIEAAALERSGAPAVALELLQQSAGSDALQLQADIYWRQQAWSEAGKAYRALFLASAKPLGPSAKGNALRAAAAFLKAGADAEFAAFRKEAEALGNSPERELINSLAAGASPTAFLDAYRRLYPTDQPG